MHFSCFLLLSLLIFNKFSAFGQRKSEIDTLEGFRAFNEGMRLQKENSHDSAITVFQLSSDGYKAYAESLPEKPKWNTVKIRAWEQHYRSLSNIANCLHAKGARDSAIAILGQILDKSQKQLGNSNVVRAKISNLMGNLLQRQARFNDALPYFRQSLRVFQQQLGDKHPFVGMSFNNIGSIYRDLAMFDSAMIYLHKALAIRKQTYGPSHPEVAASFYNIGLVQSELGEFEQALENYQQALAINRSVLGESHPDVAMLYGNIGTVYYAQGRYVQSLEYQQRELAILKQAFGESHPLISRNYNNLGSLFRAQGQLMKALEFFHLSAEIKKRIFGPQHPSLALTYNNIGIIYSEQGQYHQALEYYNQALAIQKRTLGEKHPEVANSYSSIANLYNQLGKHDMALNLFQQSLAIRQQILGESHYTVGLTYNNIATVCFSQKKYIDCLNALSQSLQIQRQAFGEKHSLVAEVYQNMGDAAIAIGQVTQGLDYHKQAAEINEQVHGLNHPNLAFSFYNIGLAYQNQQLYAQAIPYFQRALNIYLPPQQHDYQLSLQSNSADALLPLTSLPGAWMQRKAAGDDSLALLNTRLADSFIDSLRLSYTYENDKLQLGVLANRFYPIAIDVSLWNKNNEEAFYYSEKNKAAVLAYTLNEATALNLGNIPDSLIAKDKELRTQVAFLSQAIHDEELKCPNCDSSLLHEYQQQLFSNRQNHFSFKSTLERDYPQYFALKYKNNTINVKKIQEEFLKEDPNSAFLAYLLGDSVLYSFCITKDKYSWYRKKLDTTSYKNTNTLQLQVKQFAKVMSKSMLPLESTKDFTHNATILYDYLIKPFEQQIKGKDLIIIPDAELNKIPFELLIKPNPNLRYIEKWSELPYLIKEHNISYHYSANLLLEGWHKGKTQPVKSSGLIAFAPVFDDPSTGKIVSNENEKVIENPYLTYVSREDTLSRAFTNNGSLITPLPGTEQEVSAIYELFIQTKQPAKYYLNNQANEMTVKSVNLKPYKYLHFATHGLADEERPSQSCLILAQNSDSTNDNLLTSSEMYGLDLDAELVVLSACQTGKGALKAGEGIIGLTRGLLYAGARNLVVSQWNVNDASTAALMTQLYAKILSGQSNRQALRAAKLGLLNSKFACPYYWGAFVLIGR